MQMIQSKVAPAGRRSLAAALLVGAWAIAAPASGQNPIQVPIEVNQPLPNVGDQVRLRTEVLQTAPYNQDPGRYQVIVFFCPDTPENCRDRTRWRRLPATDERGRPVQPQRDYVCTSGVCEVVVRLAQPREATYTFRAVVLDLNDMGSDRSPPLAVRWVPQPPPVVRDDRMSLTLAVSGASCTALFGDNVSGSRPAQRDRCTLDSPDGAVIPIAPDGSAPAPTVHATLNGFPPNWLIRYTWLSRGAACGNPCDPTNLQPPQGGNFGRPPSDFINRARVQVEAYWDGTGERGVNPVTNAVLQPLTAEIVVDYRVR